MKFKRRNVLNTLGLKEDQGENPEENFVQLFEKNVDKVIQPEEIAINQVIAEKNRI